ncbi:MAG: hypothetical protein IJA58_07430 [Lachnospiraceae bacterium]|nr:hypothetical protein [Lachnospiraceae bacterium]
MRRSDEEFKAELKARARAYRARREKRRVEVIKGISAVMAACLLIVVVTQVDFSWVGNIPGESTEVTEGENESHVGETSQPEESGAEPEGDIQTMAPTEDGVEAPSRGDLMAESAGSANAESALDKIMISPGNQMVWEQGLPNGVERYEASEAAQKLAVFLKNLKKLPTDESIEESDSEDSSTKQTYYEIKVFYEDGTSVFYRVIAGTETKWVSAEVIRLDPQTWEEWMTLYEEVKRQK